MMRRYRRNPLDPDAHARDTHPTALVGPGGALRKDDRRGVHTTPEKLVAIWYGMGKAAREGFGPQNDNTGVLFLLDCAGLPAHPDYDAVVLREDMPMFFEHLAYIITEFDLEADSSRDMDRWVDFIQSEVDQMQEDPEAEMWSGERVLNAIFYSLGRGGYREHVLVASTLVDIAERDPETVYEAVKKFGKTNNVEDLPLEWFAEALQQWRYFVPIGLSRLVRAEIVKPFHAVLEEDDDAVAIEKRHPGLRVFTLDEADQLDADDFETKVVYEQRKLGLSKARLEWHGTDLVRARQIFPRIADRLVNPWGEPFYSEG
jgi:hypothetical protein